MKNNLGSVLLALSLIVLFGLVAVLGFVMFYDQLINIPQNISSQLTQKKPQKDQTSTFQPTTMPQADILPSENCHDTPQYFVIEENISDSVETNFLIKYKSTSDQKFPCAYSKDSNDFEIKDTVAQYYWGITDHFLLFDSGTGPDPRGLIVYDLAKRTEVFNDQYSRPATIGLGTVEYWTPTKTKATKANCASFDEYTSGGLGAIIESQVSLNLTTLTKKDLGAVRCSATQ